jgi:CHASE2 domain-containing sensor protein
MRYHDFDLSLEKAADGTIALKSWCDAHGEYRDAATLDTVALASDQQLLADDAVARAALVAVGSRLYAYTFASKGRNIEWHFGQCWGAAGSASNGVRVRLRIEAPELAVIPWEYIYSERLRGFLGVSERTPIVRYLELPQAIPSLEAPLPVRVLIAIPDQPELDTATEQKEILEALESLKDVVQVTVLEGTVTRRRIADALAGDEYHVFHFIGHGDFRDDRAVLVMHGADGSVEHVDQDRMAGLFRNHPSMKLVVLNSCRGGALSASKPFVGMAAELVRSGIPAVIAMQFEIRDDEAVRFASTLYRQLFTGRDKGRIEIAVSHARNTLAEEFPDTRAVGLPVLFTHAREGVLFNLETGSPLRDLSARSADRVKAVIRTHEHNLELMQTREHTAERTAGGEPNAEALAKEERAERDALGRAKRRLRFRNLSVVIAVAVAVGVGLAASFFGFQKVHPVFRPESYFVAFSDLFHHHEREAAVTLVIIDSATIRALDTRPGARVDSTWRGRHATVVDRLVSAGAPVIAFNLTFAARPSVRAATDSLAIAFRNAAAKGVTVLAPADRFTNSIPNAEPSLVPFARWGPNCVDTAKVTAPIMTLASGGSGPGQSRMLSLPLAAVAALRSASERAATGSTPAFDDAQVRRLMRLVVLDSLITGDSDANCAFNQGDWLFRMALDYAPRHEHQEASHRISYLDVLRGATLGDLHGKLMLIGWENPGVLFPIVRGWNSEQRFGLEVEADALNTVLREIRIAPLGAGLQFLVILLTASLGALAAYLIVPFGRLAAGIALVVGVVVYFIAGAALYAHSHALLNTLFDLTALAFAFLAVSLTRKVWFP